MSGVAVSTLVLGLQLWGLESSHVSCSKHARFISSGACHLYLLAVLPLPLLASWTTGWNSVSVEGIFHFCNCSAPGSQGPWALPCFSACEYSCLFETGNKAWCRYLFDQVPELRREKSDRCRESFIKSAFSLKRVIELNNIQHRFFYVWAIYDLIEMEREAITLWQKGRRLISLVSVAFQKRQLFPVVPVVFFGHSVDCHWGSCNTALWILGEAINSMGFPKGTEHPDAKNDASFFYVPVFQS